MDVGRALSSSRETVAVVVLLGWATTVLLLSSGRDFSELHSILDTAVFLLSGVLAFLLWDLAWRTRQRLAGYSAVCLAIVAVLELLHVITALSFPADSTFAGLVRLGTWSPAAYLLPAGLLAAQLVPRGVLTLSLFTLGLVLAAAALMVMFALPRYNPPVIFGITRPTLILAPLLWVPVVVGFWRMRRSDRLAPAFGVFAAITLFVPLIMAFSRSSADKVAIVAHLVRIGGELILLFSLTRMGTADTAQRMRAERALIASNELLESRVAARSAELESANEKLRREVDERQAAESRALTQVERLDLLQRITRGIADRQDLDSIFQVVVRSLEEQMPADFAAMCGYERHARILTVSRVGVRSAPLALELAMTEHARIDIDGNGLSRCVAGQLVYEPDVAAVSFPFAQRLAHGGLRSLVMAPLMAEERSGVFGVLLVARCTADAFSSADCEFLRQLCDHAALAANQAQLHASLRQAYEELRLTQGAVLEQERLRALGQMASGIAHDINNAISPATLYVESILTHETGFSERARKQLEVVQRAMEDVARTVARMGEFYRKRPERVELQSVELGGILDQVLDLTRAHWSDMAHSRGIVVTPGVEKEQPEVLVMAIESELREALVNLVLNAVDAMPKGGKLTLRMGHALEAGKGVARRAFVEVTDEGTGMDEETRRRCLEPFFTTKGERGTGLGLAMVYGIAQRHGIEIDIRSASGEGTTFRLTFPLSVPAPQSTGSVRIQKVPSHTKILLIDDDPILLTSLREVLVHDGHQVQTATGGKAGIQAFLDAQKAGKPFPVVITDLGMPHVDGRAVAAAIKAAAPVTCIVLLTGWGQRLLAAGDKPPEVFAVLSKPPRVIELRQILADLPGKAS